MKRCRRCNSAPMDIVRESITQRGRHQYAMCWYRCPECQEVSFSYRLLHDLPAGTDLSSGLESARTTSIERSVHDPVLMR